VDVNPQEGFVYTQHTIFFLQMTVRAIKLIACGKPPYEGWYKVICV